MDVRKFYSRAQPLDSQTRIPPEDSDDSCLSDNDSNIDEDYIPSVLSEDSDGSSPDTITSSSDDDLGVDDIPIIPSTSNNLPATTSSTGARRPTLNKENQRPLWTEKTAPKNTPVWQSCLPNADEIERPIQYFRPIASYYDKDMIRPIAPDYEEDMIRPIAPY
ncbi:hypothetical protein Btru_076714 [Bulinus truncatus]|nr:hypothetical protein Btru_076714 [Bulinus truncatus]